MTRFRIGTYNVENLFDRFDDPYSIGDDIYGRFRATPKSRSKLYDAGRRIREHGVPRNNPMLAPHPIDLVALQEIENFGALLDFVQASVGPGYGSKTGVVSQPSNDPRGIDLGCIIRSDIFRVGRVTSHRFNRFKRSDGSWYQFGRDCLQVEILRKDTREHYLTMFNCHFKSKYTGINQFDKPEEYTAAQAINTVKRSAEVLEVKRIVESVVDVDTDRFVICGDFNDTPDSDPLKPFLEEGNTLGLTNAVSLITQDDTSAHSDVRRPRDTHMWKRPVSPTEKKNEWAQIDYILASKALWAERTGTADVINSPAEQGSDHYLSFVEFDIGG